MDNNLPNTGGEVAIKQEESVSPSTNRTQKPCSFTSSHRPNYDSSISSTSFSTPLGMTLSHPDMASNLVRSPSINDIGGDNSPLVRLGDQAGSPVDHASDGYPAPSPPQADFHNSSRSHMAFNSSPGYDHFPKEEDNPSEATPTFFGEATQPVHDADAETIEGSGRGKAPKPRRSPAKTAREYWARHYENLPESSRRGTLWKKTQLRLLDKLSKATKKRKGSNSACGSSRKKKSNAKGKPDASFLAGLWGQNESEESETDPASVPLPAVAAFTKKDFFKELKARNPGVDLDFKVDLKSLDDATKSFGYGQVKADGEHWKLKSFKTPMHNHQIDGVSWMISRECSKDGPFGGILADDMGTGKTVQTLALIAGNPPTQDHILKNQKSTLIVVPSNLVRQWHDEIKKHGSFPRVMFFSGANEDMCQSVERITDCDIVLTTYSALMSSIPWPDKKTIAKWKGKRLHILEETIQYMKEHMDEHAGFLHQINWYRIVLDEGHIIKNHRIRTTQAALALKGGYRWSLSGTPIMNCYEEFYSTLCFLQDPITLKYTFDGFQAEFCNLDSISFQRLAIVLYGLIKRRMMREEFLGRPIIDLAKARREVWMVRQAPPERMLYRAVEERFRELFNQHLPQDDVRKSLTYLICQMTRLRQLVANPDIIDRQMKIIFSSQELRDIKEALNKMVVLKKRERLVQVLNKRLDEWIKENQEKEARAKGKSTRLTEESEEDDEPCCMCMDQGEPEDMIIIQKKCKHLFCITCLNDNVIYDVENDVEVTRCPKCSVAYKESDTLTGDKMLASPKAGPGTTPNVAKKGKDNRNFRPRFGPKQKPASDWLKKYDDDKIEIMRSAKLMGALCQLQGWMDEFPEDKIIIFVQWKLFSTMLSSALEQKDIKFLFFTGDLTRKQRDSTIQQFKEDPTVKVMIAGLKCGSLGLNLTCANRVIIIDPWWNTCVENQALGRVLRLGQLKNTFLTRIVVANSIDSRIVELQKAKMRAICNIMDEDPNTVTREELAGLFGRVSTDGYGNIVIEADYDDDLEYDEGWDGQGDCDAQDFF